MPSGVLVGMPEMQKSSTDRWITQMARKSHEHEGKEAAGAIMERRFTDDLDSDDDTTCFAGENRHPDWPGITVFRMLIPATKVGPIIGHKGDRVRRLCEETKACVRVIGGHLPAAERAVMIFAKEQLDEPIPPAMDALLRVYQHIINDDGLDMGSDRMIMAQLITPSEQVASLIGEQGSMINSIKEVSKTNICVLDHGLPPVALEEDMIVKIWGLPARVRKALELVASHLRKYLVHRSVIPLFDPHVPVTMLHMDMTPCHYNDHPEGPRRAVSPGCHSLYAEDLQREPPWTDSCYSRCRHPMEADVFEYRWEEPTSFGRYQSVSPGCHSVYSKDLQCEPPWTDTCYSRCRHPMEDDVFDYRWEEPTSFGRYRSVTPPHHGIGSYIQETSSPMRACLSAPMDLCSHRSLTAYGSRATSPIGPSATTERIRSLISVYGRQAHPLRQTCQSAKMGKHPHLGMPLYESASHPSRVSPSTELRPTHSMAEPGLQASPSVKMYPPVTVENLLHCRVSACGPEAQNVVVPSLASISPAFTSQVTEKMKVPIFYAEAVIGPTGARIDYIRRASRSSILINDLEGAMSIEITGSSATDVQTAEHLIKNFMAEAAAASPGHSFDSIPSYLPAPLSPRPDILTTSYTGRESSLTEQCLQMIC